MKKKKYKVSFEIEGCMIGDDALLNKKNIETTLQLEMGEEAQDGYYNREIDCHVSNIKIEKVKLE